MKAALFLHLVFAAAWMSCIFVEVLYERSIDQSEVMRRFISTLHWNTDKFVEAPAFMGVLITGALMLMQTEITPLVWTKVAFGLTAIIFNVICVVLVYKRLQAAKEGDFARWERVDHKQHQYGAVVLVTLLIALVIGGYLFSVG